MDTYKKDIKEVESDSDTSRFDSPNLGFADLPSDRESWKVMFDRLYADMGHLFERESMLIRTEMAEKFSEAKVAAGSLVVGGVMLFVGLFALTATAIILLDQVMNLWIASAIVTVVLFTVGFIMVRGAQKKLAADRLRPRQSLETLNEIKTTFKERINGFKLHH